MRKLTRRDALRAAAVALYFHGVAGAHLSQPASRKVGVLGVPFNSAGISSGVARAPQSLRAHGLIPRLAEVCDVRDYGDVEFAGLEPVRDPESGVKSLHGLVAMLPAVRTSASRVLADGRFPLLLGGDCPVMLGGIAAARSHYHRLGLLFVDGHEDAYPPHASPTGEAADMELGFAVGLNTESLPKELASWFPLVKKSDAVVIGARDSADLKQDRVATVAGKVRVVSDEAARALGDLAGVTRKELERLNAQSVTFAWLHTDLDVLSSAALPAIDYPQPGGFSWQQLTEVARTAVYAKETVGWDVTIYNPDIDPEERHASAIVDFIVAVISGSGPRTVIRS